jgi:hypothetical protein
MNLTGIWYDSLGGGSACHKALHVQDNTNAGITQTYMHILSGIRTRDSGVRAGEYIWCLAPHGHYDRHDCSSYLQNNFAKQSLS